jgi:phospholipid-binding lipoprotein MlaA
MWFKMKKQTNGLSALTALIFLVFAVLSGCATTTEEMAVQDESSSIVAVEDGVSQAEVEDVAEDESDGEVDPYENFNRKVFVFNDKLDSWVAKPVSDAYLWVTPQFVQTGIANFFNNLNDINVVLNDMLQGKLQQGAEDTGRFAVNSTVGLLGLFDVATDLGLEKHEEDFDQTLAVWGVPQGPYLILPVLGPTTSRGIPGTAVDIAANPVTYVGYPVQMLSMLNARANAEGSLKFINEAALDPYVFTRESFLQYRNHLITDGASEISEDILDLEDEFYEDEEDESLNKAEGEDVVETQNLPEKEINDEAVPAQQDDMAEKGFKLELSVSDEDGFNRASGSFDEASKSFEDASRSYQEASEKLDQIHGTH